MKFLDLTVAKYNAITGGITPLYELISTFDEAHLLAQKEMPNTSDNEQIVIIPKWCFNVRNLKEKQNELAERYSVIIQ